MSNKEFIQKWVVMLRSGEYSQGEGYLNDYGKLCCLGVACEISDVIKDKSWSGGIKFYDGQSKILPKHLAEKIGISQNGLFDPTLIDDPKFAELTKLYDMGYEPTLDIVNDSGYDFDYIADLIEYIEEKGAWVNE